MNRLTSGLVPLFALALVAGCGSEPTEDLRDGIVRLDASPSQLFIELGDTKTVEVTGKDDQGNRISTAYELTNVGSGITVVRDSSFLPIFIDDSTLAPPPEAPSFQFKITANAYGPTSFTVSAGGHDIVVPVQVVAQSELDATFSNLTPALNEQVTITAPPGVTFTPTSQVTLADPTAVQPFTVGVAPDGSTITFLPSPNITTAQLVITDVLSAAAPTLLFAPATTLRLTSPELKVFDGTVSDLTPAVNQPITINFVGSTFDPAEATFQVGAAAADLLAATPTSATVLPAPGSTGLMIVNGAVVDTLPQFVLSLTNAVTDTITVPSAVPPNAAAADINTAPALTLPGDFPTILYDSASYTGADVTGDGGVGAQYYKFTVATTDTLAVSISSDNGVPDLDLIVCGDLACNTAPIAEFGALDETGTAEFTPGTYYVSAVNFDGAASNYLKVTLEQGVLEP